ncbi:MAG: AtpZ/AtpI family protein [Alphaproteobacteria bacterium]|nr:AtpZ/AtpI family protein [Alphaproteobacteria bacterium]
MKNASEDIKRLEQKISELKSKENATPSNNINNTEFVRVSRIGLRIGVELFSAVIVGAGIGYLLDDFFGTKPWMLVVFLFFGGAAGILNVYRLSQKEDELK